MATVVFFQAGISHEAHNIKNETSSVQRNVPIHFFIFQLNTSDVPCQAVAAAIVLIINVFGVMHSCDTAPHQKADGFSFLRRVALIPSFTSPSHSISTLRGRNLPEYFRR